MIDLQHSRCLVCGRSFSEGDDVVVCPQCGAPHHRACWKQTGHCAAAERHGTAEQWRPPVLKGDEDAVVCRNCGTVNRKEQTVCLKCRCLLRAAFSEDDYAVDPSVFYAEFSPYVGIDPQSRIDGVTAADMAVFLGPRCGYYLSRFHFMRMQKNRYSWNWAAAVCPSGWLLCRKMYRWFLPVLLLSALLMLPGAVLLWQILHAVFTDEAARQILLGCGGFPAAYIPSRQLPAVSTAGTLSLALRAALGLFGNHLYRRHTAAVMTPLCSALADPAERLPALSRRGGISRRALLLFAVFSVLAAVLFVLTAASVLPV